MIRPILGNEATELRVEELHSVSRSRSAAEPRHESSGQDGAAVVSSRRSELLARFQESRGNGRESTPLLFRSRVSPFQVKLRLVFRLGLLQVHGELVNVPMLFEDD